MKTLLLITLTFLLAGCAIRYVRPDGVQASEREVLECKYEAARATAGRNGLTVGGLLGLANNPVHDEQYLISTCMRLRGYEPTL